MNNVNSEKIILALNSGSSSLKCGLYSFLGGRETTLVTGGVEALGTKDSRVALRRGSEVLVKENRAFSTSREAADFLIRALTAYSLRKPDAVGHRIVHGGPRLREHCRVTSEVVKELEAVIPLAPIHLPPALDIVRFALEWLPDLPQIACLDTAFHVTLPAHAARFPLPIQFWMSGIRRYGFHGLSCESIVHALQADLADRTIVAHLGNGASITAIQGGRSIDTTMGLTPTGGIPMATRSGDLDPGVLLHLLQVQAFSAKQIEYLVNHQAGLLGVSGESSDMRELMAASPSKTNARLAIEIFCYSARKGIGAMAAALGGLELLVFSGGIGEHAASVRADICAGLEYLGITLDPQANARHDNLINMPESRCSVRVVPSDEDLQIARHCIRLM